MCQTFLIQQLALLLILNSQGDTLTVFT